MMKTRTNVVDSGERSDQQQQNISLMILADSNVKKYFMNETLSKSKRFVS